MAKNIAVLDTNVLFSGLYSSEGASYKILNFLENNKIKIAVSVALLFEYEEILKRNKRILKLGNEEIEDILNFICQVAVHQKIFFLWRPYLKDQKDDHLLELAVASRAIYIITHNIRDFNSVDKFGVLAITPSEFTKILGR
jgi:putative PIN family toxin of toxin-antitoxin system